MKFAFYSSLLLFLCASIVEAQPTVTLSSLVGDLQEDQIRDVAIDAQGYIYLTGGSASPNFPHTNAIKNPGAPATSATVPYDVFVIKLTPSGQVVWSTLIGGPNYDRAYALEVDAQGYIYLAGRAGAGFPVTAGAAQTTFMGGLGAAYYGEEDGFIAKLSPDGSQLVWATYFGTNDVGIIRDIDVNASGEVFLAGDHQSGQYPPSVQAVFNAGLQPNPRGNSDGVVAKLSANGSQFLWATHVGGTGTEEGQPSIRLDPNGDPTALFITASTDAMTTAGAFQRTYGGGVGDAYVVKLRSDGTGYRFATYFGGSAGEATETHNLAIDSQGGIILGLGCGSTNFPMVANAYDSTYNGSGGTGTGAQTNYQNDGCIAKLSADGSQLLASTYLGGQFGESVEGISVDLNGEIYVAGGTFSTNFPVTVDGWRRTHSGNTDGFISKLSPDLRTLIYSTFHGGTDWDVFRTAAVRNGVFVTGGEARSANFPAVNPLQNVSGVLLDASVAIYNFGRIDTLAPAPPTGFGVN